MTNDALTALEWLLKYCIGFAVEKPDVAERVETIRQALKSLEEERDRFKAKAEDWEIMKDERDTALNNYKNLHRDTDGEIAGLRLASYQDADKIAALKAERDRLKADLAEACEVMRHIDIECRRHTNMPDTGSIPIVAMYARRASQCLERVKQ